MFQFGGFPTHTYVFSIRFMVLHHECFHIRISTDRSLFAAPRSFSQLIASFIGSWCQGIHLMLLFAWTFSCLVLSIFSWIAWVSWTFFRFVNSCEKVLSFCSWISFSTFRWNCNFTQIGKTYNFFANLVKNYLSSYLFVSYSSIYFIRFSKITGGLKWTRTTDLALIRRAL